MRQLHLLALACALFAPPDACGQKKIAGYGRWQVTTYFTYNGGSGISLGRGMWIERDHLQPALNLSGNLVFGKRNLGNKNRAGSRFQANAILSPMLIAGGRRNGYYEPLNMFYFGNANAVISNMAYHVALGTNFVLSPRSNRSISSRPKPVRELNESNIYSNKNRSQQLIYLGLRFGGRVKEIGTPFSVKFNIYEDFILAKNLLSAFADHYDRFYTGGGNLEFSFYPRGWVSGPIRAVAYADVYTGSFDRDTFDAPDTYDLKSEKFASNNTARRRNARFVTQEPGQKLFNEGRFFGYVQVPIGLGHASPIQQPLDLRLLVGTQGGNSGMFVQNLIHDGNLIDKINLNVNPERLYIPRGKDKNHFERLHHFQPITNRGRLLIGLSAAVGPVKTSDLN